MIVLDIETTGLDPRINCMVSLGAVDDVTGEEFYGECHIYSDSVINQVALDINGFKEADLRDYSSKLAPHELYRSFLEWVEKFPDKILGGHNIGHLDILFLEELHKLLPKGTPWLFGYRTVDLHSVAYAKLGKSLSHAQICKVLGLPLEPEPHNGLSGAKSEREAFRALAQIKTINPFQPDSIP